MKVGNTVKSTYGLDRGVGHITAIDGLLAAISWECPSVISYYSVYSLIVMPVLEVPHVEGTIQDTWDMPLAAYASMYRPGLTVLEVIEPLPLDSPLRTVQTTTHSCTFKSYIGLTESYNYCTVCDKKVSDAI